MEKWESEKHKSWVMPAEEFKGHAAIDGSLSLSLSWGQLDSGEHVPGQWCNWVTMKIWSPYMGCTARWKQKSRSSAPSRGQS